MAYDPVFAYDSDDPASLETSSTLTYIGINGTSSKGACNSVVSNKNPHWKASGSFILSSPVPQRPANNAILVDHSQPTRNLTYIGKVTPDEKDLTNIALLNGKVYTKKPADPAVSILNPNNFFLNLPVVGGASPFVTLSPIKIVKLIAIPILVGTKTCIQLEEAVYIGDTLVKRTRNPAMIREIKFVRQSVALPLISVNIEECI